MAPRAFGPTLEAGAVVGQRPAPEGQFFVKLLAPARARLSQLRPLTRFPQNSKRAPATAATARLSLAAELVQRRPPEVASPKGRPRARAPRLSISGRLNYHDASHQASRPSGARATIKKSALRISAPASTTSASAATATRSRALGQSLRGRDLLSSNTRAQDELSRTKVGLLQSLLLLLLLLFIAQLEAPKQGARRTKGAAPVGRKRPASRTVIEWAHLANWRQLIGGQCGIISGFAGLLATSGPLLRLAAHNGRAWRFRKQATLVGPRFGRLKLIAPVRFGPPGGKLGAGGQLAVARGRERTAVAPATATAATIIGPASRRPQLERHGSLGAAASAGRKRSRAEAASSSRIRRNREPDNEERARFWGRPINQGAGSCLGAAAREEEEQSRRAASAPGVGEDKLTLTSFRRRRRRRAGRAANGALVAATVGMQIVPGARSGRPPTMGQLLARRRQLYDYICIDCNHSKAGPRARKRANGHNGNDGHWAKLANGSCRSKGNGKGIGTGNRESNGDGYAKQAARAKMATAMSGRPQHCVPLARAAAGRRFSVARLWRKLANLCRQREGLNNNRNIDSKSKSESGKPTRRPPPPPPPPRSAKLKRPAKVEREWAHYYHYCLQQRPYHYSHCYCSWPAHSKAATAAIARRPADPSAAKLITSRVGGNSAVPAASGVRRPRPLQVEGPPPCATGGLFGLAASLLAVALLAGASTGPPLATPTWLASAPRPNLGSGQVGGEAALAAPNNDGGGGGGGGGSAKRRDNGDEKHDDKNDKRGAGIGANGAAHNWAARWAPVAPLVGQQTERQSSGYLAGGSNRGAPARFDKINTPAFGWAARMDEMERVACLRVETCNGRQCNRLGRLARLGRGEPQATAPCQTGAGSSIMAGGQFVQLAHSAHGGRSARSGGGGGGGGEVAATAAGRKRAGALVAAAAAAVAATRGEQQAGRSCPSKCSCVWKNGKQFADCSNHRAGLRQIPSGLEPLLQVLNLSANHLVQLAPSAFKSLNLNNLQRIYLAK